MVMMNAEEQKNMTNKEMNEEMTELPDSSIDDVTGGTNIVVIKSPKVQSGQTDAFSELAESKEFKKIRGEIE
jgi:hypothetical protein